MTDYTTNTYYNLFIRQKDNQYKIGNTTYKERVKKLNALKKAVEITYKEKIRQALYDDFKKPFTETDLTEIYPVVSEIKFVKSNLKDWMSRQKVETPMALLGSSSWYNFEPKGVCLVISPWNFPLNLTFGPLVSAIAAGNTVILKPSEMTPNISKVMAEIAIFDQPRIQRSQMPGQLLAGAHGQPCGSKFIPVAGRHALGRLVEGRARVCCQA